MGSNPFLKHKYLPGSKKALNNSQYLAPEETKWG